MKIFLKLCFWVFIFFMTLHVSGLILSDRKKAKRGDTFIENTATSTDAEISKDDSPETTESTEATENAEIISDSESVITTDTVESTNNEDTDETTESIQTTEIKETTEEPLTTEEKKTTEAVTEVINQSVGQTQSVTKTNEYEKYIFVGDSRYVQMKSCAEDDDTFIAENGVGYKFLSSHMDEIVSMSDENTKIVIGLGVNDVLSGTKKYKELLLDLRGRTNAQIYYMLINPVDDELCANNGYSVTNEVIDNFNINIQNDLWGSGIKIIDVNSYLKIIGYSSRDGLHYSADTTQNIYIYIKEQLLQY
ncbi:MAG: SGNH/GDSL hydrolase family protein [Lachnospiraceae bacterium]|nr:SGNH/GDSL hydrolase family protein [Lachnospiraceae bacterium]